MSEGGILILCSRNGIFFVLFLSIFEKFRNLMILPLCGVSSTLISDFLLKLSTDSREVIS